MDESSGNGTGEKEIDLGTGEKEIEFQEINLQGLVIDWKLEVRE